MPHGGREVHFRRKIGQRHHELGNARVLVDLDLDAINGRGSPISRIGVLELNGSPNLQKAEFASHGELSAITVFDASPHRSVQTVDMKPYAVGGSVCIASGIRKRLRVAWFRLRFGLYAVLARLGAVADWAGLERGWAAAGGLRAA